MKPIIYIALCGLFLFPQITSARIPNDPNAKQWAYEDIKAYEAWDYTTGSKEVIVAVIDNGFDTFHPDLVDNIWINKGEVRGNGIDDDMNGFIDDIWGWNFVPEDTNGDGYMDEQEYKGNNNPRPPVDSLTQDEIKGCRFHHGTAVAGIIGAKGDNEIDGTGIAWNVRLMNLKVIDNGGVGTIFYIPDAIYYAVDNGADIINISLVGVDSVIEVEEAINYAYDRGVTVIAAAGNSSINLDGTPFYPICADASGSTEKVLGISGIAKNHYRSIFSNLGSTCIDITAPAEEINSIGRFSTKHNLPDRYYEGWRGTSFATPLISGAAALIKGIQPTWGPIEIFNTILSTVHKTPPDNEEEYALVYGAGLLQVDKAVRYALSQLGTTTKVERVWAINPTSGQAHVENGKLTSGAVPGLNLLKGVDDITSFMSDGLRYYATARKISRSSSQIDIYDSSWTNKYSWIAKSRGLVNIEAGDVQGDSDIEVILSPKYSSKTVYSVYTLSGEELGSAKDSTTHMGTDLSLIGLSNTQKTVVVAKCGKKQSKISQYDSSMSRTKDFTIDFLRTPRLDSGDVDGNGVQELVIVGGQQDGPWVATYNLDGEQLRRFWGFDPSHRGGISVSVGDYDGDSADDLILAKKDEIRVFSGQIRRIGEWNTGISDPILLTD